MGKKFEDRVCDEVISRSFLFQKVMNYRLNGSEGRKEVRFINLEISDALVGFSNFGYVGAEICRKWSFKRVGH